MPFTKDGIRMTGTRCINDCHICCSRIRESAETLAGTSAMTTCCPTRITRGNGPVARCPINTEPLTEEGAVGGVPGETVNDPINVQDQLLAEQSSRNPTGHEVSTVPENHNGLSELNAVWRPSSQFQQLLYGQQAEDGKTEQAVGVISNRTEMQLARSSQARAAPGYPSGLMELKVEFWSVRPMQEVFLYCQQPRDRENRQHAGRVSYRQIIYCQPPDGEHPIGEFQSIQGTAPLAEQGHRETGRETNTERFPIQETNRFQVQAGPVEHACACGFRQQQLVNRPSPPEAILTEGRICNGTYIWRIVGFYELLQAAKDGKISSFKSPAIYTQLYGYKFCMRIYPNGVSRGAGRYVGLFVHLMQGENDNLLEWPFRGTISLSILGQSGAGFRNHINGTFLAKPNLASFQNPAATVDLNLYGYAEFAPIHLVSTTPYVKNDTVMVKIEIRR